MTDAVVTNRITVYRPMMLRISLPRLGILTGAMLGAVGRAFDMAYVDHYRPRRGACKNADPHGRDPNW